MPALLAALLLAAAPEQLSLARFCHPDVCPTFAEAQDRARQLAREARARGERRFAEIGACGDRLYVADDGPMGLKLYLFQDTQTLVAVEFVGPYVNRQYGPAQRCLRRVTVRLDENTSTGLEPFLERADRLAGAVQGEESRPWAKLLSAGLRLREEAPRRSVDLLEQVACLAETAGMRSQAAMALVEMGHPRSADCAKAAERRERDHERQAKLKAMYLEAYVLHTTDPAKARELFELIALQAEPDDEYGEKAKSRVAEPLPP